MRIWFPEVGTITTPEGRQQEGIGISTVMSPTPPAPPVVIPPNPVLYTNYMRRYLNDTGSAGSTGGTIAPSEIEITLTPADIAYLRRYLNDKKN